MVRRILLCTQWFDPEPTPRGMEFARELVRRGFDVEVVTGFPNYPGGKVYPGYKIRLLQREEVQGVRVTRLPLYPSHDRSPVKRILNYVSFAASLLAYGFFTRKVDVFYAYHPPLTVGVAAGIVCGLRRIPLVYDIQDMWPDTLRATGMVRSEAALGLVAHICNWVYRRAARLVVISPGFRRLLLERGVPAEKISVVYNWADESALLNPSTESRSNLPEDKRFRILFAGNMGRAQSLDTVLEAAAVAKSLGSNACFVFLGGGLEVDELKRGAVARNLDNVLFLPAVPMNKVGAYLSSADVLLVHLRPDPLFAVTIPSKTQAYMAVGKPLLMAVGGDAANLVSEAKAGITAEPGNPQAIAAAVIALERMSAEELVAMGKRGSEFYQQNLSARAGISAFIRIFEDLAC